MKILYLSYTLPKPSSPNRGVFLLRRIEELLNQNINLTVITTEHIHNIFKYKKKYNFNELGFNVNQVVNSLIKFENPYNYTNIFFNNNVASIYKIYKQNKCELIHAHFIRDGLFALKLKEKHNIPYIVSLHGFDITIMPLKSKRMRDITLRVLESADKCIFVSESLLNTAKAFGYSMDNYTVINNGYKPDIFKHSKNSKSEKNLIIGFCGYLIKRKRADKLPIVFKYIKDSIPHSKLIIIGDGPLKSQMISDFDKLELLSSVTFTGSISQEEMSKYMNLMDVFILPSIHEGFPTVVPEAMACGVQVVASDADGTPEAVANAGYIVNQNEPNFEKKFAEQVVYALKNPIPKEVVLERAKELTWENIVLKEIEVYKEVLEILQ